jgi:hypothetical protein
MILEEYSGYKIFAIYSEGVSPVRVWKTRLKYRGSLNPDYCGHDVSGST